MNWVTVIINGREVSVASDENSIHIYNAYLIKDDLKMRGYRWNPSDKSWFISPGDISSEMEVLKNNLQSSTSTPTSTPTSATVPATIPAAMPVTKKNGTARTGKKTGTGSGKELSFLPDSCSVADLRNRIDRLIREGIRGNIWVRGIIASDGKNYKWASYLDLKDEDENRDIFFRVEVKKNNLEKINGKLDELGVAQQLERDLPVFCNVDVHLPLRNVVDVRLNLLDILPEYTQSKIRNQREITLDKLKAEGILENQKRLIVPAVISRIGLITSEQGTSVKDIKAGLHPYGNKYRFFFVDSRMEGANAVDSVIRAISFLEADCPESLDAIIIARGGGSEQSLSVFNDLRLCRRVCQAGVPVFTAIGHEKDVSAIECCSWITPTPSTPSGIGKYLQNRYLDLQEQLSGTVTRLIHRFTNIHHGEMEKIRAYLKNIPARVSGSVRLKEERFFSLARGLERSVTFTVRDHERRIRARSVQLVQRYRELRLKNKGSIRTLTGSLLSRAHTLRQRELNRVEKTISRLDFDKRRRDNRKREEEVLKQTRRLFARALKTIDDTQKQLRERMQLVQASDPQQILKKGFTLTLDNQNRIVKSLEEFNRLELAGALLRFHDGTAEIIKKEEAP